MAGKKGRARPSAANRGEFVVVLIGPDHVKYSVPRAFLEHDSGFFREALKGRWTEAQEKVVKLEDVKPEVFSVFVNWLYTGVLPMTITEWLSPDARVNAPVDPGFAVNAHVLAVNAMAFGDKYLASGYQCAVHNLFVDATLQLDGPLPERIPHFLHVVIAAFDQLPSNNPLLDLLVDTQCAYSTVHFEEQSHRKALHDKLPHDFLIRVMMRYIKVREGKASHNLVPEAYYMKATSND